MINQYLKNLEKLEFAITYACRGSCKHCQIGERVDFCENIAPNIAAYAIRRITEKYDVKTVMVFGGEPLLFPETVYSIIHTARAFGVSQRQLITSGYFSDNVERIRETAHCLSECGVNDILLSVDAFHQESIPTDKVVTFSEEVKRLGIPLRLNPAWLVSKSHDNPYNRKTREILDAFLKLGITEGEGNIIFPEGNACKYLSEYFTENIPKNPYTEDPCNVKCLSFDPYGSVLSGNIYKTDVLEIMKNYTPYTEN